MNPKVLTTVVTENNPLFPWTPASDAWLKQVRRESSRLVEFEHLTLPCNCDPRESTCSQNGWIRCTARLVAVRRFEFALLRKLRKEAETP